MKVSIKGSKVGCFPLPEPPNLRALVDGSRDESVGGGRVHRLNLTVTSHI